MNSSRSSTPYNQRSAAQHFDGLDPDTPVAGYYRTRLRGGGAPCGVRIWYGAPTDPVTGEIMDRSHRWQAEANGEYIDVDRVWPPRRGADPITEADYQHFIARAAWAKKHAPDSAIADPRRKVDPLTAPIAF